MKIESKQETIIKLSSIFQGMPSLLEKKESLTFDNRWPICRDLPTFRNSEINDKQLESNLKFPIKDFNNNISALNDNSSVNEDQQGSNSQLIGKQNKCGHTQRKHYAKKLCMPCYFRIGRQKKATNCKHTNKTMHAKGMCSKCYQKWIKKCNNTTSN